MATPTSCIGRGKLVSLSRKHEPDQFGIVDYVKERAVHVNLIYNCKNKPKACTWPIDDTRLVKKTEYRLMYDTVVARARPSKGLKPDASLLPGAGTGLLTYKQTPKGTVISVSCYGCSRIQPSPGFDNHTFFFEKAPQTAFPYQASLGAFVNDGTVLMHKKKLWKLPAHLYLTNAELKLANNTVNMPLVTLTRDLQPLEEVFIDYEPGTTFANQKAKMKILWGPAPVFGDLERHQVNAQYHKLYDYYYREEDEEEEEEEAGEAVSQVEGHDADVEDNANDSETEEYETQGPPATTEKRKADIVSDDHAEKIRRTTMFWSHLRIPSDNPVSNTTQE